MADKDRGAAASSRPLEQFDALITVLDLVRSGSARTRPELGERSGLGRTVITQRVAELMNIGLLADGPLGAANGGRAPRQLQFRADAGVILAAELGASSITVGITDLAGTILAQEMEPGDITSGPQAVLGRVRKMFDQLLEDSGITADICGVGIGLPGPVEFATGRPSEPPIMPGWDGYPVREYFATAYNAPTWVDNEVNLMALGEVRAGRALGEQDILYVKIGTGIGAGLVSGGRLHRGGQGCAGDIGHVAAPENTAVVCRCGNIGCLETLAGGAALARDGEAAARQGRSPFLAALRDTKSAIDASDVALAAQNGDRVAVELLTHAGHLIGNVLATFVSFFNPSVLLIGGGVAEAGEQFLAAIRQTIYRRSLPLATRELRIVRSPLSGQAGLTGAAFMVIDELFSRERLVRWLHDGSPTGKPELAGITAVP
ncbi:ROK family protein [Streptomyces mirabilis]